MNIITILGSPKKKGRTAQALDAFETAAANKGHKTERIHLEDYVIKGCAGCMVCRRTSDNPGCVREDDALFLFGKMIAANCLIYASPLYAYDFTSQMKALFDRQFCLVKGLAGGKPFSLLAGKLAALLVTCGWPKENNSEELTAIFNRTMRIGYQCDIFGNYIVDKSMTADFEDRAELVGKAMFTDMIAAWN